MTGRKDQHGPRGRTEPTLGDIDSLDRPPAPAPAVHDGLPHVSVMPDPSRRRPPAEPARTVPAPVEGRRGWLVPLILLLVVGLVTVLWLNQDALRGLVPRTGFNDVLARATAALQAGHLDGSDGTSARELFQAARALEPDNDRALAGLRQVGQAELAQADSQLQAGKLDEATRSASAARELLGGGSDVEQIDREIAKARAAQIHTSDVIDQATQALAAGRLDGDDGAGALYARVLAADPGNAVASHGLDQVGAAYAAQARQALDAGDAAGAAATIDKLAALLPRYGELPSLRAAQAQAQRQHDDALDAALKQGMDALRAGRITGTGDDTALAHFKAAQAIDPDNPDAQAGLGKVAQALTVQANAMIDSGDAAQAATLLDQAAALAPKSADLAAARARLEGASASAPSEATPAGGAATVEPREPVPPVPSPAQQARVVQLVQQAKAATQRGDIMLPPGQSAYDLYRSALAIDGNDPAARNGLQGLPAAVTSQFDQALGRGDLARAGHLLATLADLSPGDAGQSDRRQRLASAWLDRAEHRLDNGDRPAAAQALDQARKLAPQHPRVQELSARLNAQR